MPNIYLDTNALRALKFETEIAALLNASKVNAGTKLIISEWVLYERSRQYYQENFEKKLIKISVTDVYKAFKHFFQSYGVEIIVHTPEMDAVAETIIQDDGHYFKAENPNDRRDALIYVAALNSLNKEDAIIVCEEGNLSRSFEKAGFEVKRHAKDFVKELFGDCASQQLDLPDVIAIVRDQPEQGGNEAFIETLKKVDAKYAEQFSAIRELPQKTSSVSPLLEGLAAHDLALRLRVLGYTQWFSPISKQELYTLLEAKQYKSDVIDNNAERLRIEELLLDTGNHWLPNTQTPQSKEICEQAMASVMPEIIEIIGAS